VCLEGETHGLTGTKIEMQQIEQTLERMPLTSSQLEAVKWLSQGKHAEEIGMIMGRTKYAVQVLIRDAKGTVNAATATSLVATALRQGWIS
jgi:DNA-binding CsgD family transcriptional regulator